MGSQGRQLPLMSDWNDILLSALEAREMGLAQLVGIRGGQPGPAFEQALGDFLAWQRILDLSARFFPFGLVDRYDNDVRRWKDKAESRSKAVVDTLRTTLYQEFSSARIDTVAATSAYKALFERFDLSQGATITVATTNYDPAVEVALAELDRRPDVGAVDGPGGARWLHPQRLIDRCRGTGVAVLHLHGKVGWYTQSDGQVRIEAGDHSYNESSGTPTVLMPDPSKNPLEEPAVKALWDELDLALSQATHCLVLGHSLNDPVLVEHIRTRAGGASKAVSVLPESQQHEPEPTHPMDLLPGARQIPIRFGPEPDIGSLEEWGGDLRNA
jgi:hypothetical protein